MSSQSGSRTGACNLVSISPSLVPPAAVDLRCAPDVSCSRFDVIAD